MLRMIEFVLECALAPPKENGAKIGSQGDVQANNPRAEKEDELRGIIRDAIHYWEPRRLAFNLLLVVIAFSCIAQLWGGISFRIFESDDLFALWVIAIVANVCYSAAYVIDIPIQLDGEGGRKWWRENRCVLFTLGTAFWMFVTLVFLLFFWW